MQSRSYLLPAASPVLNCIIRFKLDLLAQDIRSSDAGIISKIVAPQVWQHRSNSIPSSFVHNNTSPLGAIRFEIATAGIALAPAPAAVDCSAEVKAATDPLNLQVADLTAKLSNANGRITKIQADVAATAARIAGD